MKKHKKLLITLSVVLGVFLLLVGAAALYFGHYYHADLPDGTMRSDDVVRVVSTDDYIAFLPTVSGDNGLIFYQGAKVDEKAYAPLLRQLAERGIVTVLVKMPWNFAIFDVDAAVNILEDFQEYSVNWYVGGHSLGGSMAAECVSDNPRLFKGVILLAAYSTADLRHTAVLSVYGDRDQVLNMEKYRKNKANLPDAFTEVVIEGGNHANFGHYGKQSGDGRATISREQQIAETVDTVCDFLIAEQETESR